MNRRRPPCGSPIPLLLVLALLLAACQTAPVADDPASGPATTVAAASPVAGGSIVEAPRDLTAFAPDDTSVTVDARTVNLRRVFEDLGEDATLWYQHVQTLANPFFEGRLPGSRGSALTAEYVEFYFRLYGLEPSFPATTEEPGGAAGAVATSYRQPFSLPPGRKITVQEAALSIGGEPLAAETEFAVVACSSSGRVEGPVAFVGYGIAAGPQGYSSFDEDTDLTGRVALLLRYAPMDEQGERLWGGREARLASSMPRKIDAVAARGAAAILVVNPPAPGAAEGLESIDSTRRWGSAEVPVLQITPHRADELLRRADPEGRDLAHWARLADRGLAGTVALRDDVAVSLSVAMERQEVAVNNVGGVLRGRGTLADEWVLITAHHDHVGDGSLGGITDRRNRGRLHPGADDNASGTAGVLTLARRLSAEYAGSDETDLRSILFLTFDAEEMGLIGSRHFADHPPIDLEDVSLAINLDMIGRLRADKVEVLGTGTGEGLGELLRPRFESSGMIVAVDERGSNRSDDASFHRKGVPAIHFFTGMTREYTTPRDEAFTVNPAGAARIIEVVQGVALDVARRPEALTYREPPAARRGGEGRGYAGVRLGILPAMEDETVEVGVLVEGVPEGTSAAEGGVLPGDRIVGWNRRPVESMRDLATRLREHSPGDRVELTVLREGREVVLEITLKRSQPPAEAPPG
jgi:hypothetical protein